jgi:hypothetical protein
MNAIRRSSLTAIVTAALWGAVVLTGVAHAEDAVGSVASLDGRAEAQRSSEATWNALSPGDPVYLNDRLRTLADSRLKVLFGEDAVVTLGAKSELTVDQQVVPQDGGTQSYFSVLVGTVRALVSERYGAPGGSFEMETPTAVAAVRGTEFVLSHSVMADETTVLGLASTTLVRAQIDSEGTSVVELGPGEVTVVKRGAYPIVPAPASEDVLQSLSGATSMARGGARGISGGQTSVAAPEAGQQPPSLPNKGVNAGPKGGRPKPPPPPIPR